MTIRLTKLIVEEIKANIQERAFAEEVATLREAELGFVRQMYSLFVDVETQRQIKQLPHELFAWTTRVRLTAKNGDASVHLSSVVKDYYVEIGIDTAIPWSSRVLDVGDNVAWFNAITSHNAAINELNKRKNELSEKLMQILQSVPMLEQLLSVWPQVRDYAPIVSEIETRCQKKQLPAVEIHALNILMRELIPLPARDPATAS